MANSTPEFLWVPDRENEWCLVRVENDDGASITCRKIEPAVGEPVLILKKEELKNAKPTILKSSDGVPDLITLSEISEQSILSTVRKRYKRDEIYTAVGEAMLVSVNPYKELQIYGEDFESKYRDQKEKPDAPPHIFRIAESCFQAALKGEKKQTIIISGESGAGKTEATKKTLNYLARSSHEKETEKKSIEQKVLDANPLLEAFGNAKTVRNDNSSRFGKFIEVHFTPSGGVKEAKIINYLLEKSRLVTQHKEERNYHIFYQLLYGAGPSEKAGLLLGAPESYNFLKSGLVAIPHIDDRESFKKTVECLEVLGFSEEEKREIFEILSGLLHLGNVEFKDDEKNEANCFIVDKTKQSVENAAKLLRLDSKELQDFLCTKKNYFGKDLRNVSRNSNNAVLSRNAFVKTIYSALFDWLVERINKSIGENFDRNIKGEKSLLISLLDIFGFEKFEENGFEQLCINYANEKLQKQFIICTCEAERAEYLREGLEISNFDSKDNSSTINLIEESVFKLLADECKRKDGSNDTWYRNFEKDLEKKRETKEEKERFMKEKMKLKPKCFKIEHYAGEVEYDSKNFFEKNADETSFDANNKLSSESRILQVMFNKILETDRRTKGGLCIKFKTDIADLVKEIDESTPSYIRCVKPNSEKRDSLFDSRSVNEQLIRAGMKQVVQIREKGYSYRPSFEDFLRRYRDLVPREARAHSLNVETIMKSCGVVASEWLLGKTRVLMKRGAQSSLDTKLEVLLRKMLIDWRRVTLAIFKSRLSLLRGMAKETREQVVIVRKQKEEEERRRKEEEERRRKEEEERRRQEEEERRRREEDERRRREEEERRRREEDERRRREEDERRRREEDERLRQEAEDKRNREQAEKARKEGEEEERRRRQEEDALRAKDDAARLQRDEEEAKTVGKEAREKQDAQNLLVSKASNHLVEIKHNLQDLKQDMSLADLISEEAQPKAEKTSAEKGKDRHDQTQPQPQPQKNSEPQQQAAPNQPALTAQPGNPSPNRLANNPFLKKDVEGQKNVVEAQNKDLERERQNVAKLKEEKKKLESSNEELKKKLAALEARGNENADSGLKEEITALKNKFELLQKSYGESKEIFGLLVELIKSKNSELQQKSDKPLDNLREENELLKRLEARFAVNK